MKLNYDEVYDFSKEYENASEFFKLLKYRKVTNIRDKNDDYWVGEVACFIATDYSMGFYNPFAIMNDEMDLRSFMEIRKSVMLKGLKFVSKEDFKRFIEEIELEWKPEQIVKHREDFVNRNCAGDYIECSYTYFRLYYYFTDKPDGIMFNMSYYLDDFDHNKDNEIVRYWIPIQSNYLYKGDVRLLE